MRELFGLLYDVVAPFPQLPPLFPPLCQQLPGREFCKAVFRRQYLAVYEVQSDGVLFVLFRHSSLDPDGGFEELLAEYRLTPERPPPQLLARVGRHKEYYAGLANGLAF